MKTTDTNRSRASNKKLVRQKSFEESLEQLNGISSIELHNDTITAELYDTVEKTDEILKQLKHKSQMNKLKKQNSNNESNIAKIIVEKPSVAEAAALTTTTSKEVILSIDNIKLLDADCINGSNKDELKDDEDEFIDEDDIDTIEDYQVMPNDNNFNNKSTSSNNTSSSVTNCPTNNKNNSYSQTNDLDGKNIVKTKNKKKEFNSKSTLRRLLRL